jgi:hypothetical protein
MKTIVTAGMLLLAMTSAPYADITYRYNCQSGNKTYQLWVNEGNKTLTWQGKNYRIVRDLDCAKYGWKATGNGTSFRFCTATQGYGYIEDNGKKLEDGTEIECEIPFHIYCKDHGPYGRCDPNNQ